MHRSARMLFAALLLAVPVVSAFAAEKEDPAKFKYRNLPVDVSCLEGYHPSTDAEGNKVFPCVANAEIRTTPGGAGPAMKVTSAAKPQ